ncbi:MAG: B12-binding domain-containing protein [Desulfobacterales bacterium]
MQEDLVKEAEDQAEIPEQSARIYKEHLGELVEKVNSLMLSRADIKMLIGENPAGVMLDNHRNHAFFMSNVFSLNAGGLLARTVPWVYSTYRNHGFDYAYFPAHLNAWCRALEQLLPADDVAPLIRVYEWMLSRHEDFIRAAEQYTPLIPEPAPEWKDKFEDFLYALLKADKKACTEIAKRSVDSSAGLADFYLNVIQPAMYAVGNKWEAGEISVAAEHLASAVVNKIMSMHYLELMKEPAEDKGRAAVMTSAANEFHEIGATMVTNVLEAEGWEVAYLGANTPLSEFVEFVRSENFDVVMISVTMAFNLEFVKEAIQDIRENPETDSPWIMVGGLVFNDCPGLAEKLGADGYAADCRQAADLADRWKKSNRL